MSDLISRQAAIDAIEITPFDDYGDYMRARELIEQLPSAQPQSCKDAVSKADVLETYAELYDVFDDNKEIKNELHKIYDKINALQAAQPEIIACADCKHWICHDRRCGYWNHGVKPLDWCCHGERRQDD